MIRIGDDPITLQTFWQVVLARQPVTLSTASWARIEHAWQLTERVRAAGKNVYGLTTGVGALRDHSLAGLDHSRVTQRLLASHRIAPAEDEGSAVARGIIFCWIALCVTGRAPVRPQTVDRLLRILSNEVSLSIPLRGSVSASDLGPNAELVSHLFSAVELEPIETLILINNSAPTVAAAALALSSLDQLLSESMQVLIAALEAFAARLEAYHPIVVAARAWPLATRCAERMHELLQGSSLGRTARLLQDPLSFRTALWVLVSAEEARDHLAATLERWLNGYTSNPIALPEVEALVSCGNFESMDLALALDTMRLALFQLAQSSAERTSKLLNKQWSGLPTGLLKNSFEADTGLAILELAAQAVLAEIRLAAQPISLQTVSGVVAAGIEDRGSFALIATRLLQTQIAQLWDILAIEALTSVAALTARPPETTARSTQGLLEELRPLLERARDDLPVAEAVAATRRLLLDRGHRQWIES